MNRDMKKEDAIKLCKYYKGESTEPKNMDPDVIQIWKYEYWWVNNITVESDPDPFSGLLRDYFDAGLLEFCQTDNVPITIKATLYNRFVNVADGMCTVDEFKDWYTKNYSH